MPASLFILFGLFNLEFLLLLCSFSASDLPSLLSRLFISGYLQHLLKLKSMDISKRVFDSMFRQNAAGSLPRGLTGAPSDLPKDLTTTPGGVPGAVPFPGSILAGFPPLGSVQPPLPKPNPSEESETNRPLSNPNDDKFYEDMISCSDEEVDEDNMEDDSTNNNNNDYDADMRQYEYASYKHMERNKRREEQLRGLMGGIRLGDPASGLMTVLGKGNDKYPRTNIEYRTDLGELTIETGASTTPPVGTSTKLHTTRSRKHHSSSSSMSVTPFSSGSTGGASTSATSPRDRSFIDKASVRQFCTQEGEHIFRCNICLKTYTHISNFCRHFLSAHDDRYKQEISCPVCFKMFTRRDNMMTHTKQVHRITLMRGTLQPVYLDQEPNGSSATVPPPPSTTTATSTS
uniref:Protein tramtrack, beta isoform n=3 Tax=Cacopsylla melanoneura TaxID=428564 RepID=A0A8D8YNU5_9HEMI